MAEKEQKVECVYSKEELARSSHLFGTTPEVVLTALTERKITEAAQDTAYKIVRAFLERKV